MQSKLDNELLAPDRLRTIANNEKNTDPTDYADILSQQLCP